MSLFPDPKERTTVDLVVLGLTFIIGFVIVVTLLGIILIELIHPTVDTDPLISIESEILGVLVGALVGFVGGRQVGRSEGDHPGAGRVGDREPRGDRLDQDGSPPPT